MLRTLIAVLLIASLASGQTFTPFASAPIAEASSSSEATSNRHEFEGSLVIEVNGQNTEKITFDVVFIECPEHCTAARCYYGWISNYQINNESPVPGYPTSPLDPVFRLEVNSLQDFTVVHNSNIEDEVFEELVYLTCLRFNPFGTDADYEGEGTNFELTQSQIQEQVKNGDDGNVRKSVETYNFDIQSSGENIEGSLKPDFKGKITITIEEVSNSIVENLPCDELEALICPTEGNCVSITGQEIKTRAVEEPEYEAQIPDDDSQDGDDDPSIEEAEGPSEEIEGNGRLLQSQLQLMDRTEVLYNQVILGYRVKLTARSICTFIHVGTNNNYLRCSTDLRYDWFGNTFNYRAFSQIRRVGVNFNYHKAVSGTVNFPVTARFSFIPFVTFRFRFRLAFQITINLSGRLLRTSPLVFQLNNNVETVLGGNVQSYVQFSSVLRVGVYSRGTMMKIANRPRITVTSLGGNRFYILTQWYLIIYNFRGEWGLFAVYRGTYYTIRRWGIVGNSGVRRLYNRVQIFS